MVTDDNRIMWHSLKQQELKNATEIFFANCMNGTSMSIPKELSAGPFNKTAQIIKKITGCYK